MGQRLLKYDTLAHLAALKLYHNRSIEFGDRGQLCNYTCTTHSFTTACVTYLDQLTLKAVNKLKTHSDKKVISYEIKSS